MAAPMSATKKYYESNLSTYEHYIKPDDIHNTEYEIRIDSKFIIKDTLDTITILKGTKFKILEHNPKLINSYYYVFVNCNNVHGYILVSNIRKPRIKRHYNKGEICEGLITVAILNRLIASKLSIGSIKRLITAHTHIDQSTLQYDSDNVISNVSLNHFSMESFKDVNNHDDLTNIYISVMNFCSMRYVTDFINDSNVKVGSIGNIDYMNTKTDISVSSNERNLNISLKCGASANRLEETGTKIKTITRLFNNFGMYMNDKFDDYQKSIDWFRYIFSVCVLEFNAKDRFRFNYDLAYGIINAATKHEKDVIMLHIIENTLKIYSFDNLFLKINRYNLRAELDDRLKCPSIVIKDEHDVKLITFKLEVRQGDIFTIRIYKDRLLKDLTMSESV